MNPESSPPSSSPSPNSTNAPKKPVQKSGFVAALEHTGIPPSLLKRPSLPSRNWLIFFGVTGSIISAYIYDRRQCRKLKEGYVERVKALGEELSWQGAAGKDAHLAWPRKLTVYGAKWPGDEDYDQCLRYFRRYVKPIFVAAAIDYDMVAGKKHGDIVNRVADEIKARRYASESLSATPSADAPMPSQYYSPSSEERERLEITGGTVIIGRATLKEYMAGVVRGWTEPCEVNGRKNWGDDAREEKARESLDDRIFDDPPSLSEVVSTPSADSSTSLSHSPTPASPPSLPPIPPLPPVLLVPFVNHLGFTQVPYMIIDFFYRRKHVREGGEAALRAVWSATRDFNGPEPSASEESQSSLSASAPPQGGDLDFALSSESYYRSYLSESSSDSPIASITRNREKYYSELPAKLWVAREFAIRGGFEDNENHSNSPSEEEVKPEWKAAWDKAKSAYKSDPSKIPPSEVELRMERFEKEKKWKAQQEGWEVVKPERGVLWDDRLRGVLKVFVGSDERMD